MPLFVKIVVHNADNSVSRSKVVPGEPSVFFLSPSLAPNQYLRIYAQFVVNTVFVEVRATLLQSFGDCGQNDQWGDYTHIVLTLAFTDIDYIEWESGLDIPGYDWLPGGCFSKLNGTYLIPIGGGPRAIVQLSLNNCGWSDVGNCGVYNPVFDINELVFHMRDLLLHIFPYGCPLVFHVTTNSDFRIVDCPPGSVGFIPAMRTPLFLGKANQDPANFLSLEDYWDAGGRVEPTSPPRTVAGPCDLDQLHTITDLYWWADFPQPPFGFIRTLPVSGKGSISYYGLNVP